MASRRAGSPAARAPSATLTAAASQTHKASAAEADDEAQLRHRPEVLVRVAAGLPGIVSSGAPTVVSSSRCRLTTAAGGEVPLVVALLRVSGTGWGRSWLCFFDEAMSGLRATVTGPRPIPADSVVGLCTRAALTTAGARANGSPLKTSPTSATAPPLTSANARAAIGFQFVVRQPAAAVAAAGRSPQAAEATTELNAEARTLWSVDYVALRSASVPFALAVAGVFQRRDSVFVVKKAPVEAFATASALRDFMLHAYETVRAKDQAQHAKPSSASSPTPSKPKMNATAAATPPPPAGSPIAGVLSFTAEGCAAGTRTATSDDLSCAVLRMSSVAEAVRAASVELRSRFRGAAATVGSPRVVTTRVFPCQIPLSKSASPTHPVYGRRGVLQGFRGWRHRLAIVTEGHVLLAKLPAAAAEVQTPPVARSRRKSVASVGGPNGVAPTPAADDEIQEDQPAEGHGSFTAFIHRLRASFGGAIAAADDGASRADHMSGDVPVVAPAAPPRLAGIMVPLPCVTALVLDEGTTNAVALVCTGDRHGMAAVTEEDDDGDAANVRESTNRQAARQPATPEADPTTVTIRLAFDTSDTRAHFSKAVIAAQRARYGGHSARFRVDSLNLDDTDACAAAGIGTQWPLFQAPAGHLVDIAHSLLAAAHAGPTTTRSNATSGGGRRRLGGGSGMQRVSTLQADATVFWRLLLTRADAVLVALATASHRNPAMAPSLARLVVESFSACVGRAGLPALAWSALAVLHREESKQATAATAPGASAAVSPQQPLRVPKAAGVALLALIGWVHVESPVVDTIIGSSSAAADSTAAIDKDMRHATGSGKRRPPLPAILRAHPTPSSHLVEVFRCMAECPQRRAWLATAVALALRHGGGGGGSFDVDGSPEPSADDCAAVLEWLQGGVEASTSGDGTPAWLSLLPARVHQLRQLHHEHDHIGNGGGDSGVLLEAAMPAVSSFSACHPVVELLHFCRASWVTLAAAIAADDGGRVVEVDSNDWSRHAGDLALSTSKASCTWATADVVGARLDVDAADAATAASAASPNRGVSRSASPTLGGRRRVRSVDADSQTDQWLDPAFAAQLQAQRVFDAFPAPAPAVTASPHDGEPTGGKRGHNSADDVDAPSNVELEVLRREVSMLRRDLQAAAKRAADREVRAAREATEADDLRASNSALRGELLTARRAQEAASSTVAELTADLEQAQRGAVGAAAVPRLVACLVREESLERRAARFDEEQARFHLVSALARAALLDATRDAMGDLHSA